MDMRNGAGELIGRWTGKEFDAYFEVKFTDGTKPVRINGPGEGYTVFDHESIPTGVTCYVPESGIDYSTDPAFRLVHGGWAIPT